MSLPMRRYKGRFMKEKAYNKLIGTIERNRRLKEERRMMAETGTSPPNKVVEGRRIVDFQVMSRFLNCVKCREVLSLADIVKEARFGLASVFHVQCRKCELINFVPSSGHDGNGRQDGRSYDVNIDAIQGAINAGLNLQNVKKFLSILHIPGASTKIFHPHKELHGPETKEAAEERKRIEEEEEIKQEKKREAEEHKKNIKKRKRRSKDTQNPESATATESATENNDNEEPKTKAAAQNSSSNESTGNPTDKFQQYQQDFNNAYTAAFQNSYNNVTDSEVNSAATTSQNYTDLQPNVMTRIPYKKVMSQQYNNDQATMEPVQSTSLSTQSSYYPPNPFMY